MLRHVALSLVFSMAACGSSKSESYEPDELEIIEPPSGPLEAETEDHSVFCIRITEDLKAEQQEPRRTALPQGYAEQSANKRCYGHFDSAASAAKTAATFFAKEHDDSRVIEAIEEVDNAQLAPYLMTDAPMLISLGYLWGLDVRTSEPADALVVAQYPSLEGSKVVGEMVALSGKSQRVERHEVWDFSFTHAGSNLLFGKVFSWDVSQGEKPGPWLPKEIGKKELEKLSFAYDGMSERTAATVLHSFDLSKGATANLGVLGGTEFFELGDKLYTTAQPMLSEFCNDMSDGAKFTPKNYPYCGKSVWEIDAASSSTKPVEMTRALCEAACGADRSKHAQTIGWSKGKVGDALFETPEGTMALLLVGRKFETLDGKKTLGAIYLQPASAR